jgi:hypothetical protein
VQLQGPIQVGSIRCPRRTRARPTMNQRGRRTVGSDDRCAWPCAPLSASLLTSPFPQAPGHLRPETPRCGGLWSCKSTSGSSNPIGSPRSWLAKRAHPSKPDALEHQQRATLARTPVRFLALARGPQSRSAEPPRNALHPLLADRVPHCGEEAAGVHAPAFAPTPFERGGP